MSTNWDLYLFCQEKKRNEKEYGEISYSKIETQLKKFMEIDATYIELGHLDDRTGIAKTLETHNAVYHKKCYDKIGQEENRRLLARVGKNKLKRTKTELGTELCIFCGERNSREHLCPVGEFHSGSSTNNQNVKKLTES